jgi:ssRNA-specific RNase YbeY (16S rRNA maturation enzyme)
VPQHYKKIKEAILGKRYDLSVAFVPPSRMQQAMKYKKESAKKVSNVLAFPLSKTSGEILICKKAAKPFTVDYLFIHGLLHLKGHKHGATMERIERRVLTRFGLRAHE